MDWDAVDARDVVRALAAHFGFAFAAAEDFLFARQLQQAQHDDDEVEQVEDAEQWEEEGEEEDDDVIIPMMGQDLVAVSMTVGSGAWGCQDGTAAEATFSAFIYACYQKRILRVLCIGMACHVHITCNDHDRARRSVL